MSQPPYGTQPPYGGQPPFGGQPPSGGQPPYGGPPASGGSQAGWGQPTPPPAQAPPPTQPGYGPPPTAGLPSYGPPTQQYGQPVTPGYGSPIGQPPYGGPGQPYGAPEPDKKSPVPFIILGLVVLLVAVGVGLFFVLKDDPTPLAVSTSASSTESTEVTEASTETESSTEDTGSPGGDEPNFPESEALALTFIDLMAAGQHDSALFLLCEDGRDASDGDGFVDGQALADDFFGFLGATTVTNFEVTDVFVDPDDPDRDIVEVDIATDVGTVPMAISMLEESGSVTICGYDIP